MAKFEDSIQYIFSNEGVGYEEPPATDQPTNTGIIADDIATFRNIPISLVTAITVKMLTMTEIMAIYKNNYWMRLRLDEVDDQGIATCIFDTGVNRGLSVAVKYTQRVCNMLGAALVVDGQLGLHTIVAIKKCNRGQFIRAFENLEAAGYMAIIAAHPRDEKYRAGWMARTKRLFSLI